MPGHLNRDAWSSVLFQNGNSGRIIHVSCGNLRIFLPSRLSVTPILAIGMLTVAKVANFYISRILTSVNLCNFSWSKFSIVKIQGLWKCQNGSFEQNIFKIPYCVLSWTFQVWIWSGFRKHYRDEGYYLWYTTSLRGAVKISRELDWMDRMWWQDWGSAHYLWPKSIKYGRKGGNNSHC